MVEEISQIFEVRNSFLRWDEGQEAAALALPETS
jgi:hypothetical protein